MFGCHAVVLVFKLFRIPETIFNEISARGAYKSVAYKIIVMLF